MAVLEYKHHSERAEAARFSRYLNGTMARLLFVLSIIMLVGGLVFVRLLGEYIGWLVAGMAAIPYMLSTWHTHNLASLPTRKGERIDDLLAGDILARLKENASPKEIAHLAATSNGGGFMAVRLGLTGSLLENLASANPKDAPDLWVRAREIQKKTNSHDINGAVIAAAIVSLSDVGELVLTQMHAELDDMYAVVEWYDRIKNLIKKEKQHRKTGGIARDWAFGYVPFLQQIAINISASSNANLVVPTETHNAVVRQMVQVLGQDGRRNIALIGQAGVGKTTAVRAFADMILDADSEIPRSLKFRQVYMMDASTLISNASGPGDLERMVTRAFNEAYRAKNIIICLENAELFFEEGPGSVDLSNLLLPILEAGRLSMIVTLDEQRFLEVSSRKPHLAHALNRVVVPPSNREDTIAVMQNQLIVTEFQQKVTYMYQSLSQAYRLSERYIHDLAMPGRAFKLLESAANYAQDRLVTMNSVDEAIEQTMDVKVSVASDANEREMLLNLEDLIHERMINQSQAVSAVSDALRRARAGVRNQDRPIGTFLFLGPTGVGKTELAKALAEVYFGGEDRLVRLDLNEFSTPGDVSRLIADGAEDAASLTARIRKQPFSVVLLDEIEKAHDSVLNTLLQLLDEGILRDVKGREVSFRDAIIIATSNAGADRIREYVERGYQLAQFEGQFVDELIDSGQFKPEFLNRFDEIVVFKPLDKPELVQIINLMIQGINKTLAVQKISVNVADDAKMYLVEKGYDPRLGARPMRRVVQRAVENTVAKQMLGGKVGTGGEVTITRDDVIKSLGGVTPVESLPQPNAPALYADRDGEGDV